VWFLEMCDGFGFEIDRNGAMNIFEVPCQERSFYVLYQEHIKVTMPSEILDRFSMVGGLIFIFFLASNTAYFPL